MYNRLRHFFAVDERFLMHRYASTRLATTVGSLMLVSWFLYAQFALGELRWDLVSILVGMGLTKVAALIYFNIRH